MLYLFSSLLMEGAICIKINAAVDLLREPHPKVSFRAAVVSKFMTLWCSGAHTMEKHLRVHMRLCRSSAFVNSGSLPSHSSMWKQKHKQVCLCRGLKIPGSTATHEYHWPAMQTQRSSSETCCSAHWNCCGFSCCSVAVWNLNTVSSFSWWLNDPFWSRKRSCKTTTLFLCLSKLDGGFFSNLWLHVQP